MAEPERLIEPYTSYNVGRIQKDLPAGSSQVGGIGTAVLGGDGMSAEVGATTFEEAEARTAIAMAANAQRVVVPVDGSKIGKVTLAKMVPLSQIDHLVTDSTADVGQLEMIGAAGVQVHVVEMGED